MSNASSVMLCPVSNSGVRKASATSARVHRPEMVTIGPAQKGQHVVIEQVGNGGRQTRPREGDRPFLPEAVLQRRDQFPQPRPVGAVQLVDGDQQAGPPLREVVGQRGHLGAQVELLFRRRRLPGDTTQMQWEGDRRQPAPAVAQFQLLGYLG